MQSFSQNKIRKHLFLKVLTYLNIFTQISFPLAVAFTPAIVAAKSSDRLIKNAGPVSLQARVYTLGQGETVSSVAKKYNISLDELRKLNQFRTFSRGFDHLQTGDELDVPVSPLPKVHWTDASPVSVSTSKGDDTQTQKIASYASQFGGALSSEANGDAAASVARGIISNSASAEIQQWLSYYGNARLQLDADKYFSLKNSQLDLLVPLSEKKDSLVFTQGSLHRTDDRTQSNLGVGYRWFASDWMLGANSFIDNDISRGHSRIGLGGEYWRDFLKVGVNTYYRLSKWKNSPDYEDYEERPANGWDIRTQFWMPSLPQLGGKLTYEQYYGNEVALFGRDQLQRNPHAISAAVSYTPVPLLTFTAEQRQGQAGKSDTRFGMEINYQVGVPWQQLTDPDAVAAMRSLAGSRYDFVERNNNIVLEYRKKQVIRLKMSSQVTGYAGEQKSLSVSVTSKYGLDHIDWSASSLIAAGGKIVQNGADWTVMLPAFQSSPSSVNTYTISGVAVDKKGNVSERAETQVTVTQAAIDAGASSLSPATVTLPADGKSQQEFVLKVNDKEGHPVDIAENEISITQTSRLRAKSNLSVSAFKRRAKGEYVMKVTAGTIPGTFTFTPLARNTRFASADITLIADNATALINSLSIVNDNAVADGKSQNRFRVAVVDAQNNPVSGQSVRLKADHGATISESVITEADGTVVVPVTSRQAGETTLTASVNDKDSKTLTLTFRPDSKTAKIEQKNFSILPEISLADGKTQKKVTVRVTDAQGNVVPDMPVKFSADNGAVLADDTVKTDTLGEATTTLISTVAGMSRVSASVINASASKDTTFIGNNATAIVTAVDSTAGYGIAGSKTAVTFRALIKDQNGNPLSDIPVDWKSDKDNSIVTFDHLQTLTSAAGIAEVGVTSTQAYSDVVVTASTNASSKSAPPFTFIADKQNPVIEKLSSNKLTLTANGKDQAELKIVVTDTNGNPLSGVVVALSNTSKAVITPSRPVTGTDGVASASLTTLYAGPVELSASLDKGGQKTLSLTAVSDEKTADVTVKANAASATVGQAQPITLTATVVDENNNPVSGASVVWHTSHNQLSESVSQTNQDGNATVELTGTQASTTMVNAVLFNGRKGSTQVIFRPGEPVTDHSQLSVSPQSITADGKSQALASFILRDEWDNPVPGKTISWSADNKSGIQFTPTEKGYGVYQAMVTGTSEGVWSLTAKSGTVSIDTPLTLLANQYSAVLDSVTISSASTARADGQDAVTIHAQVKDKNGNTKLKGVAVGWSTTLGTLSSSLSSTDENGVAEITLSSRAAGEAWVSAMLGGGKPVQANSPVSFTAGDISADKSTLAISPANIVAGKESAVLHVTARDAEGNLLTGLKNKIHAAFIPDLKTTVSSFSEMSPGVYDAVVSGNTAGTTQVSVEVNSMPISQTAQLTLSADSNAAVVKGDISVTPSSATVGDSVTYAAVLTDANGNPLGAGIPVTWSANEGSTLSSQVTHTDNYGKTFVTLSRQKVGSASVSLILPSGTISAPDVTFSAGDVNENRSELTLTPAVIVAGKENAKLTLTLRDDYGNLITGKTVSGQSDDSNVIIGASQEDSSAPGRYTMMVSSNKAGSAKLSATVGAYTLKKSRVLTVNGDTDSWKLSAVTPDRTRLTAGDTQGVTYSTTVTDVHGNLLKNVVVSWQLNGQAESYEPTSRTNENGVAITTVKSHTAGLLQMTAYLDANNHAEASNVIVVADHIKNATFNADKTTIGADGKDTVDLTVSLEDNYGNPITGKILTIEGADSLAGFSLSAVKDLQNGLYKATATATTKGQVTLRARVEGNNVGNPVTVTVGAITPDLRFANTEQQVTWTRSYNAAQTANGMPAGLKQIWSSSDSTVATVDGTGKVTLLKSGETNITVFTPGNSQYNAAMASYKLKVNRANPGLVLPNAQPIIAKWADGVGHSVSPTYTNADVKNSLTPEYSVSDKNVVTVDTSGRLKPVKPGSTIITVSTPETDQFEASSGIISYTLGKGVVNLGFSDAEMSTTDKTTFTLQPTKQDIPQDADIEWSSSDENVIKLSKSGSVQGNIRPGRTRISVNVSANDYYESSSDYYDVNVYGSPKVTIGSVTYLNEGLQVTTGTWKPLFKEDVMRFSVSSETSNQFTAPERLMVTVTDEHNNILSSESFTNDLDKIKNVEIIPTSNFWGKTIRVNATAVGHENLSTNDVSSSINIWKPRVPDIVKYLSGGISYYIAYHGGTSGTNACRSTYIGPEPDTDFDGQGDISLNTGQRSLISNVVANLSTTLSSIAGNGQKTGEQIVASLDARSNSKSVNQNKAIYMYCSWNHGQGNIEGKLRVKFNGDEQYKQVAKITDADGAGKNKDKRYALDFQPFK